MGVWPNGLLNCITALKSAPNGWSTFQSASQFLCPNASRRSSGAARTLSRRYSKKISVAWHDVRTSVLEGVIARGDRRLGAAIYAAWKKGCVFDSWTECFDYGKWMEAMAETGLSPEFYASRTREKDEILPWDHIDVGVSKAFLWREWEKAQRAETTENCREKCAGCGAVKLLAKKGGVCVE